MIEEIEQSKNDNTNNNNNNKKKTKPFARTLNIIRFTVNGIKIQQIKSYDNFSILLKIFS